MYSRLSWLRLLRVGVRVGLGYGMNWHKYERAKGTTARSIIRAYMARVFKIVNHQILNGVIYFSNYRSDQDRAVKHVMDRTWGVMNFPISYQGTITTETSEDSSPARVFSRKSLRSSKGASAKFSVKRSVFIPPLEISRMMARSYNWRHLTDDQRNAADKRARDRNPVQHPILSKSKRNLFAGSTDAVSFYDNEDNYFVTTAGLHSIADDYPVDDDAFLGTNPRNVLNAADRHIVDHLKATVICGSLCDIENIYSAPTVRCRSPLEGNYISF